MVRDGTVGDIIGRVIDVVPSIAEPWFLNIEAICEFGITRAPNDLMKVNLPKLAEERS